MRSMQIRHELRQALGPTFSHMAEAQLIKTLTALASAPSSDTTAGDVGEARAVGKVTLEKMKAADSQRLNDEYQRLVQGLAQSGSLAPNEEMPANPVRLIPCPRHRSRPRTPPPTPQTFRLDHTRLDSSHASLISPSSR